MSDIQMLTPLNTEFAVLIAALGAFAFCIGRYTQGK